MTSIAIAEDLLIGLLLGLIFYSGLGLMALNERSGVGRWVVASKHIAVAAIGAVAIFGVQTGTRQFLIAKVDSEIAGLTPILQSLAVAGTLKLPLSRDEEKRALSLSYYAQPLQLSDRVTALGAIALIEGNREKYGRALELASRSISVNPNDPALRNARGVLYYDRSNYKEALLDFDSAKLLLLKTEPESTLSAIVSGNTALAARDLGFPVEARINFDASIAHLPGASLARITYLIESGEFYLNIGKPQAAREQLGQALELAVAVANVSKEGDVHRSLAEVSHFLGEPSNALSQIELAAQKHSNNLDRSMDLETRAEIEYDLGNVDAAFQDATEGLALAKSAQFQQGIAQLLHLKGRIEQLADRTTEAEGDYADALTIFDSLGYLRGKADVLCSIGYLRYEAAWKKLKTPLDLQSAKPDFELAKAKFEQALGIFESSGYREGAVRAYGGIGIALAFLNHEQLELGIANFQRALDLARTIQYPLGEANQLGNLGIMYKRAVQLKLGNQTEQVKLGRENLQKALSIHRRIGYKLGEARQLANLASLALSMGHCGEADTDVKQATAIFTQLGAKLLLERVGELAGAIKQECAGQLR